MYFGYGAALTKHDHEDAADDRSWNGNKDGTKLADDAHDHEDDARAHHHTRAANLLSTPFSSAVVFVFPARLNYLPYTRRL